MNKSAVQELIHAIESAYSKQLGYSWELPNKGYYLKKEEAQRGYTEKQVRLAIALAKGSDYVSANKIIESLKQPKQ